MMMNLMMKINKMGMRMMRMMMERLRKRESQLKKMNQKTSLVGSKKNSTISISKSPSMEPSIPLNQKALSVKKKKM